MTEISHQAEPAPTSGSGPILLTFLIADVRGYTSFAVERGNEAAARLASTFAAMAEEVVAAREGRVIELRGDEALAVFPSPRQALPAAVELQHHFREQMEIDPTLPLKVGMGIDAGEVVPVKDGYRGLALNLAARLCSLAGPGEVYGSEGVVQLAQRVEGLAYVERGRVQLKGFADPIRVIQILPEEELPAGFPPLVSLVAKPSNLPLQPTPFIGRQREVGEIIHMLEREEVRLLTLTGPGGSGKTRLSLHAAGALLGAFERGVFFVPLTSVNDPKLIVSTIASTLKVKELPSRPLLDTLQEYLHDKHLLLVLDNFEHLLDGAVTVSDLLAACPDLKVLVTSRAVLHLSGEYDYPVPPLQVPDPKQLPDLEALSQYEAVALFIERARAVKPNFAVTNQNAPAVAAICNRLDGLPLALELAAARSRYLPPPALLARLSSRLTLLTGGARDAPSRQQTLRATIDWSYSLLREEEQQLFARLGVFQGGCTLEAAEVVCKLEGDPGLDTLDGVGSLVEKSLLRQEGEDAPRFLMLETIWEYALERLEVRGEAEPVRAQHATYYLSLAEEAEPELQGAQQVEWIERLEADHDNLRAALGWFLQRGQVEQELQLAGALQRFWQAHTHFSEGRRWLDAGLSRMEDVSVPVRLKALRGAGGLALIQGDWARTDILMEELLLLAREHADSFHVRSALTLLGVTAYERGDHRQATQHYEECLSSARAQGSPDDVANALLGLGLTKSEEGLFAEAVPLIEEARALFRAVGNVYWEMVALGSHAYISLLEAKWRQAQPLLVEYLETAQQLREKLNIAASLEGLAVLAAEEGRAGHAARLFAAAEAVREETGGRLLSLRNRTMIKQGISSTREQLGEAAWLAAWEEGRAMTMEQAVRLAGENAANPEAARG